LLDFVIERDHRAEFGGQISSQFMMCASIASSTGVIEILNHFEQSERKGKSGRINSKGSYVGTKAKSQRKRPRSYVQKNN